MSSRPARAVLVGLVLLAVPLSACGGSSHKQASGGTAGASTTTPTAGTSPPVTTKTSSAPTGTRTASTPAETTTAAASGVHLPATFTVDAHGGLSPPSVTAPAGIPIELTVISGDGKAHHIVLEGAHGQALSVPAGGRASTAITRLAAGRYAIQVDGARKGTLVIGGQPGP